MSKEIRDKLLEYFANLERTEEISTNVHDDIIMTVLDLCKESKPQGVEELREKCPTCKQTNDWNFCSNSFHKEFNNPAKEGDKPDSNRIS